MGHLQKPYSCSQSGCSKRYTDPSSLRKHLRAHKRAQLELPNAQLRPSNLLNQPHCSADFEPSTCLAGHSYDSLQVSEWQRQGNHQQEQQQQEEHQYLHQSLTDDQSGQWENHQLEQQQQQHSSTSYEQQHWQYSRSWCAGQPYPHSADASGQSVHQQWAPTPAEVWPSDADHQQLMRSMPPINSGHWTRPPLSVPPGTGTMSARRTRDEPAE